MPQSLKEGSLYMVGGLGITMAATFGAQVLATRALGPESYGVYGLVLSNSLLVTGFFDAGLSSAVATFIAERSILKNRSKIIAVLQGSLWVEILALAILAIILLVGREYITSTFFTGTTNLLYFFFSLILLQGVFGIFSSALQGFRELRSLALIRSLHQLFLMAGMGLLWLPFLSRNAETALWLSLLSMLIALVISILFTLRYIYQYPQQYETTATSESFKLVGPILSFATPAALTTVTTSMIQSSGPAILTILSANNPGKALGIFVVIISLAGAFDRLIKTVVRSAFPYLVHWNSSGGHEKTRRYTFLLISTLIGGYTLLGLLALVFGRPIVLLVYGSEFEAVADYLPLGIFIFAAVSIQDVFRVSLFSLKKPAAFLVANLAGLIVYGSTLAFGYYLFRAEDLLNLIFFSLGLANLVMAIIGFSLFSNSMTTLVRLPFLAELKEKGSE